MIIIQYNTNNVLIKHFELSHRDDLILHSVSILLHLHMISC